MKKPKIEEIQRRITEMKYNYVDAEEFFNHYMSIGWLVGKNKLPMVSWHHSLAGWNTRNKNKDKNKVPDYMKNE
jgi:hypothetical protein